MAVLSPPQVLRYLNHNFLSIFPLKTEEFPIEKHNLNPHPTKPPTSNSTPAALPTLPLKKPSIHTEETGNPGICCISWVQVHLVGVEASGGDGQVAAQAVDVLHQGHVHLQAPLARRLLRVPGIDAGAPGRAQGTAAHSRCGGQLHWEHSPTHTWSRSWCPAPYSPFLKQSCLMARIPADIK